MNIDAKKEIRFSSDTTLLEIICPIGDQTIPVIKAYFAKWSREEKCWHLPLSRLNARAVHILAKKHKFRLHPQAATIIRGHFKETQTISWAEDGKLILQGLEDLAIHTFLRQRKRAQFLPEKDQWIIRPDYELAKYILNNLPANLNENCRSFLESFTATTDPLELNSLDGKILHEPGTTVIANGITVVIGPTLHLIAQAVKVDYRIAIAFEGRPLSHTIGIVIRCEDFAAIQTCAEMRKIKFEHHTSAQI
jgi:hypothetical protein